MAAWRPPSGRNHFEDDPFEEIHSDESSRIRSERQLYEKRSVDSSNRSLRLIEESKSTACKIEEELQYQEDSLVRTEETLDRINGDIDIANRQITSLKSIWGAIGNYFRKPLQPQKPQLPDKNTEAKHDYSQIRPRANQTSTTSVGWEEHKDVFDPEPQGTAADVLDKNLDSIRVGLSELKGHALLLGETLDRHDDIIERVTYKAGMADKRIEESDRKIRQILKK